ncbi:MAG: DUF2147 domain-containing protein [Bacteroidales bacterium]
MKKQVILSLFALILPLALMAQSERIVGTWYTEEGTSTVDIVKNSDGKYYGKISWLKEPMENGKPKVDDENPDSKLAKRPIMGLPLVNHFAYDSKEKQYTGGTSTIRRAARPTIAMPGSRTATTTPCT